jgi:hypothetical protein
MLINQGRNRSVLFITRTTITIPGPTGIMLTGVKLIGVKVNVPYLEYDFEGKGYTSAEVNTIIQTIDGDHVFELTWRVISLQGNDPITDETTYDSLIAKGFEIYGDTLF